MFAERHGLPPLTSADRARLDGRRNSEIFPILFKRDVPRPEWLAYEEEKEGLYRDLSRGRLLPMKGLQVLIDRLKASGIAMALATSAPEANVTHTLRELGLAESFPVIVRGDQVPRGKPAPDVFIEAARRLGVDPDRLPRVRGCADGDCRGAGRRHARGGPDHQFPGLALRAAAAAAVVDVLRFRAVPQFLRDRRCGARGHRSIGQPCRSPATANRAAVSSRLTCQSGTRRPPR